MLRAAREERKLSRAIRDVGRGGGTGDWVGVEMVVSVEQADVEADGDGDADEEEDGTEAAAVEDERWSRWAFERYGDGGQPIARSQGNGVLDYCPLSLARSIIVITLGSYRGSSVIACNYIWRCGVGSFAAEKHRVEACARAPPPP